MQTTSVAGAPGSAVSTAAAEILALGEPMVEFNCTGVGDGRLYLQGFGGDTSNFAIAAARQGARAGCIGALGDDANGRMLRALWDAEGVDHGDVRCDAEAYTAIHFVTHSERGHEFSYFRQGSAASRLRPADPPKQRIETARVLHLSGITLAISDASCDTAFAAIDIVRSAGVAVSFDTNLRLKLWPLPLARALIGDLIGRSHICLPSLDGLQDLTGLSDPDALAGRCLRLGAATVAPKLGAAGALVAAANERHRIAPHPCRCVDATGAGATFGGAFVARRRGVARLAKRTGERPCVTNHAESSSAAAPAASVQPSRAPSQRQAHRSAPPAPARPRPAPPSSADTAGIACHALDVRDAAAVVAWVDGFSELHVVVSCAGGVRRGAELEPEAFAQVVDINLNGTMRVCAAARAGGLKAQRGAAASSTPRRSSASSAAAWCGATAPARAGWRSSPSRWPSAMRVTASASTRSRRAGSPQS
jgi:2-dehydro-3-deoxygluconokinase